MSSLNTDVKKCSCVLLWDHIESYWHLVTYIKSNYFHVICNSTKMLDNLKVYDLFVLVWNKEKNWWQVSTWNIHKEYEIPFSQLFFFCDLKTNETWIIFNSIHSLINRDSFHHMILFSELIFQMGWKYILVFLPNTIREIMIPFWWASIFLRN